MRTAPLLCCLVLTLAAGTASANPIRMHVELSRRPLGDGEFGSVQQAATWTITPDYRISNIIGVGASREFMNAPWHPDQLYPVNVPVEEAIRVTLSFDREAGGPPVPGSPSVILDAHLRGGLSRSGPGHGDVGGSWGASDPVATLLNEFADPSISPDLMTLFAENTSFFGTQTYDGLLIMMHTPRPPASLLAVPDPTPIPEPATIAAWSVVGLLALASARRRRLAKLAADSHPHPHV